MKKILVLSLSLTMLLFGALTVQAAATGANIGETAYDTLQLAFDAAKENDTIVLNADVTAAVSVNKNVKIDLNGHSMQNVAVAEGSALTCFDSTTDDFTVAGETYGKVLAYSGEVVAEDGYVKIAEAGAVSFHKVSLDITAMSLRVMVDGVAMPSVYYKSNFYADEVVAGQVSKHGIALSIKEIPNAENMGVTNAYSAYTDFKGGADGNEGNGTLLRGIMKTTNSDRRNKVNADIPIYGRPYMRMSDGTYVFGEVVNRSLKEQIEAVDDLWSGYDEAVQSNLLKLHQYYKDVLLKMETPNIRDAADPAQDGILKILVVGNSHGLDSTRMLYDVFAEQAPEQKVIVANLHYDGCQIAQHAQFMTNNEAKYQYHKNEDGTWQLNFGGKWNNYCTAEQGLTDENWDVIITQQMNYRAGIAVEYNAKLFNTVVDYIWDSQVGMPKLMWHMVWANPDDYENFLAPGAPYSIGGQTDLQRTANWRNNHEISFGDGTYGSYQSRKLYDAITMHAQDKLIDTTKFLGKNVFADIIPTATTIQYAHEILKYTDLELYSDYTHASDFSRLMASYTWFAKIMGVQEITHVDLDAINPDHHRSNSRFPSVDSGYALTEKMKSDIIKAVNWALAHPYTLPEAE